MCIRDRTENAQNEILDVRKLGQQVVKTTLGTLIIVFALKNYAQKWSQIVKMLDGCPQNDDFGIFGRSMRTRL